MVVTATTLWTILWSLIAQGIVDHLSSMVGNIVHAKCIYCSCDSGVGHFQFLPNTPVR